jgi:pyruvate,water dikinase
MLIPLKKALHRESVGQKALNLAILSQKFPVPPGFVIPAEVFQQYVAVDNNVFQNITEQNILDVSTALQQQVMKTVLPQEFIEELHDMYCSLNIEETHSIQHMLDTNHEPLVIVRPCPLHTEKGLHSSVLGVQGIEQLKTAILECWASFFSEDALRAHIHATMQFAVIVQKMIDSSSSGILHTSYKMNKDEVMIFGCKGLGIALSTGLIVPDKYFITKKSLAIASIELGRQPFMIEHDKETKKVAKMYLQEDFGKKQKVLDKHIGELTLYSKEIEELFGKPMEIEFAIFKDMVYFVNVTEEEIPPQEQPVQKSLEEMSVEEIQKKEDEISHHITEELEKDLLIAKAVEKQEEMMQQTKFIPIQNPDPHDINSLVLSVDFDRLLEETKDFEPAKEQQVYVASEQKKELSSVTEPIAPEEQVQIAEAKMNNNSLNAFEKTAGELIISCFKELKNALPKEQWSSSPELRHVAVLAQNYSQKNVAPTPAQVKFAMDAVEKVKK